MQTVKEAVKEVASVLTGGELGGTTDTPTPLDSGPAKMHASTWGPPIMTSNFGIPMPDMTHSMNVAGHVLASDVFLMEKQQAFNRSKLVERMVHPCGMGAFGYFEVTKDMTKYCKAAFLDTVGKKTPVFVRFSTVTPGREFPDSCRNPRGFAIKFYTEEGNYDIVGLNFPVFFVRDPAMGPDVIRSQQRNPQNFLIDYDAWFDFMSLVPESLHAGTMMFSDYGHPYGFRHMHGYGAHTFKWVNREGEAVYIKYHFISEQGTKNFTWEEAVKMCGEDPDFAKRDLFNAIKEGDFPSWKMMVQIMPAADALTYRFDPFDLTKVWPRADYPMHEFGRLVLNKNVANYHRDVEQAAFSPGSLVPGIEPSPDPVLQYRCFFYRDTQLYRLGVNMNQIPVNCPFMAKAMHPHSRDGLMRADFQGPETQETMEPHYYPNSTPGAPKPSPAYNWQPVMMSGVCDRLTSSKHEQNPDDDFLQPRELYTRVMSQEERNRLHHNIAVALKWCRKDIQQRFLLGCYKIHPDYARGIIQEMNSMRGAPAGMSKSASSPSKIPSSSPIDFATIESEAKRTPIVVDRANSYNTISTR